MLLPSAVIAKTGAAAFSGNGLNFYNGGSGNNYLIITSLSGVIDSALGAISIWVRFDAASGVQTDIKGPAGSQKFYLERESDNSILMKVLSSGGLQMLNQTAANIITDNNWHHILASWDTNHTPASSKLSWLFVDDVNVGNMIATDDAAFSVNYTAENPTFPRNDVNIHAASSEIWYAPGQYIDFSNSANRAKFSSANRPISLGATGNLPTGVAPAVYLHNAAATAGTNSGTGGNFTIQGTILDTSPP